MTETAAGSAAWTPPMPPGRLVELPGRGTTFVRDTGDASASSVSEAPPLLLLHGLGASGDVNWFRQVAPLAERGHRVITLDHRGHGRGIRPEDGRFRLADCADDAVSLLDVLGLRRAIAVGYSMGGPVSQLMWYRHPERVAGLVECATARNFVRRGGRPVARRALPGFLALVKAVPVDHRKTLRDRMMGDRVVEDAVLEWLRVEVERNDPDVVIDAARAVASYSSRPWITGVAAARVPAVSVVTLADKLVPARRQYGLARAMGGDVVAVEADHLDVTLAHERFTAGLVRAVDQLVARLR